MSPREYNPLHLDIAAFARNDATLSDQTPLAHFTRLKDGFHEAHRDAPTGHVTWQAHGYTRVQKGGAFEIWLDLQASADAPLACQLCLEPDLTPLLVDRTFRFVGDERTAAQLDEDADDDVLVISRNFDLMALIEDELLLDLPLVPQHDVCPSHLPLPDENDFLSPDGEEVTEIGGEGHNERPHPFAALQTLKSSDGDKH